MKSSACLPHSLRSAARPTRPRYRGASLHCSAWGPNVSSRPKATQRNHRYRVGATVSTGARSSDHSAKRAPTCLHSMRGRNVLRLRVQIQVRANHP
jgi:hypothetical protein